MTEPASDGTDLVSSHDLVLAVLPAPLLAAVAVGWFAAIQMATAVVVGCLPAVALIGYALFLNPPA